MPYRMALTWTHQGGWLDAHVRQLSGVESDGPSENATTVICAYGSSTKDDIVFTPSLPDRAMIVRLPSAMHVLPGEEVNLYLLSPLFLRIELARENKLLHEVPTFRPSDTWFGPMSDAGTLSYGSPSPAFLDLREVPRRPHCAITALTIRNLGATPLKLDRINIPSMRLSLFYSRDSGFWTDRLTLERRDDDEMAQIRLDKTPPPEASPSEFLSGPRAGDGDANPAIRAFSRMFTSSSRGGPA